MGVTKYPAKSTRGVKKKRKPRKPKTANSMPKKKANTVKKGKNPNQPRGSSGRFVKK